MRRDAPALASLLLIAGCAPTLALRSRLDGLSSTVAEAERNGAMACAPRELAVAKSQIEFAQVALAEGRLSAAKAHATAAEPNARAALERSPPERCAEQPAIADSDGDGVPDTRDLCPLEPEDVDGYLDADGCPDPDNDADGVADDQDRCKNEPEDRDGFQDADGCPDPDNDGDGVADVDDYCPNTKGIAAGDKPGCPKNALVVVTEKEIRITQQIQFEFNKAVIKPGVSFKILDDVAAVLKDNPKITVEVQGHTDNVGGDAYNMKLSQSRADAVRAALIARGVSPTRLVAKGYGFHQPLVPNSTDANRALNRRVQFIRTEKAEP